MARATLPASTTPWEDYADDYDRIRDTMARVLDGFEDFNAGADTHTASAFARRHATDLPDALGPGRILARPAP